MTTSIAREMVASGADVILTTSTPSLQAVANANRDGRVIHVFALVSDPFHAGDRTRRRLRRTIQTHHRSERIAGSRGWFQGRQTVVSGVDARRDGVESWRDKRAALHGVAREVCAELGITLLEATAETRGTLAEAMDSVIARGAQALWVGGDNIVMSSIDVVVAAARRGNVPVFTVTPGEADRGTFLDLGLDYHEVGRQAGRLAGRC